MLLFLQKTNCFRWIVPACPIAHLKTVGVFLDAFFSYLLELMMLTLRLPLPTYRFELPADPPRSPDQHVADAAGVQSAGVGSQSAGQFLR